MCKQAREYVVCAMRLSTRTEVVQRDFAIVINNIWISAEFKQYINQMRTRGDNRLEKRSPTPSVPFVCICTAR